MSRSELSLSACIIGAILLSVSPGFSQTPAPKPPTAESKKLQAWEQKTHQTAQAKADKRTACLKLAKEAGYSFYNRHRYVKRCMSR